MSIILNYYTVYISVNAQLFYGHSGMIYSFLMI